MLAGICTTSETALVTGRLLELPIQLTADGRATRVLAERFDQFSGASFAGRETVGMAFEASSRCISVRDRRVLKIGRESPWRRARGMGRRHRSIGSRRPRLQNVEASGRIGRIGTDRVRQLLAPLSADDSASGIPDSASRRVARTDRL